MVSIWAAQIPHAALAQLPIQSMQSGSCSAPITSEPPCLTGVLDTVVAVAPPELDDDDFELEHAPATIAMAAQHNAQTGKCRTRITESSLVRGARPGTGAERPEQPVRRCAGP